jgi:hypothetical protein
MLLSAKGRLIISVLLNGKRSKLVDCKDSLNDYKLGQWRLNLLNFYVLPHEMWDPKTECLSFEKFAIQ